MLDFGFSEVLVTSLIALVVLGPKRLPTVARQVGNWMGRARAMARQLSEQLDREVSALNADELLKQQPARTIAPPPAATTAPSPPGAAAQLDAAAPPGAAPHSEQPKPPNE
jgi:sec-independent protein translocase protein TatB